MPMHGMGPRGFPRKAPMIPGKYGVFAAALAGALMMAAVILAAPI